MTQRAELRRRDVHPVPVIDGRRVQTQTGRWRRRIEQLLVSSGEHEEATVEQKLAEQAASSRPNLVAVLSTKGGVGKSTSSFVIGGLLADRLRLRVVAVDANPDFGTLASLAPERLRSPLSAADLLADIERLHTAAQLRPQVTALPTGLHLLAAPRDPVAMARLGPGAYGELLALLGIFYDLILLDLGTGVAGDLAQLAIGRADQVVLVTALGSVTSNGVADTLEHVDHERATVVWNMTHAQARADSSGLDALMRERGLPPAVAIPYDAQLAAMLDTATYTLHGLERRSRVTIKRLSLQVAEQFV